MALGQADEQLKALREEYKKYTAEPKLKLPPAA